MSVAQLVTFVPSPNERVKAKVEQLTDSHALIRVTGRNQRRYRQRQLLLVPRGNLSVR